MSLTPTFCHWCRRKIAYDERICAHCLPEASSVLDARYKASLKTRKVRRTAADWDGKTYGKLGAEECVKYTHCTICGSPPGKLCAGAFGQPTYTTHWPRRRDFTLGLRAARAARKPPKADGSS